MSYNNFLSYLQQLLTMLDHKNEYSVALAYSALNATVSMARLSRKIDRRTLEAMEIAEQQFMFLADHQEDYSGIPGEYEKNERRRRRLAMMLRPGC